MECKRERESERKREKERSFLLPGRSGSLAILKSRLETTLNDSCRLRASLVRGASRLVWIRFSYAFGTSYAVGPGVSFIFINFK